ncbi:hypothetical protein [Rubritalea tangerina]|uniref:hypothetical protein n=1 Tax=Rubritalea tangerina TaxID=430798 RepID=UPI00361BDBBC
MAHSRYFSEESAPRASVKKIVTFLQLFPSDSVSHDSTEVQLQLTGHRAITLKEIEL